MTFCWTDPFTGPTPLQTDQAEGASALVGAMSLWWRHYILMDPCSKRAGKAGNGFAASDGFSAMRQNGRLPTHYGSWITLKNL
jgi:hypothetical protein